VDMMPDATEHNNSGWVLIFAGILMGGILMFKAGKSGVEASGITAVSGMGLHNVVEGVLLASGVQPMSTLILLGCIAHKLPEGIAVSALTNRLTSGPRYAVPFILSLLIPVGSVVIMPETLRNSALAFASGVLAVVLSKVLFFRVMEARRKHVALPRRTVSMAAIGGAVLAGLSCLVV